jgi:hypothetical protein
LGGFHATLEAALAFAITMLALSLVCSSIVEVIHRTFKLREAGLKYMLEQLFDQVLVGYLKPGLETKAKAKLGDKYIANSQYVQDGLKTFRDGFVERMRVNRSPVGVKPDPTLAVGATQDAKKPRFRLGDLWGGHGAAWQRRCRRGDQEAWRGRRAGRRRCGRRRPEGYSSKI